MSQRSAYLPHGPLEPVAGHGHTEPMARSPTPPRSATARRSPHPDISLRRPGDHVGSYRIESQLSHGGMGVVYRAVHGVTGTPVALKTVGVESHAILSSIRAEIGVLARLEHPNVVRVLDHGVHGGLPWFAMELIGGATLRPPHGASGPPSRNRTTATAVPSSPPGRGQRVVAATGTPRAAEPPSTVMLSPEQFAGLCDLICQICDALVYIHSQGVVHRDLKPDNIILRDDRSPVIIDFGLLSRFGGEREPGTGWARESMQGLGNCAGTLAYMSPEQIRGDLVDPRSDIYALGCIIYELLAGRPPFESSSAAVLALSHLSDEPAPLDAYVRGIPAEIPELVSRLLAKDPRRRPGHAGDIVERLRPYCTRQPRRAGGLGVRSFLYRPRLAGRDSELETLGERLDSLEETPPRGELLLLSGDSGIGKTRLALEFARTAKLRGYYVLTSECSELSGQLLGGFHQPVQNIADLCRERGRASLEQIFGAHAPVLSEYLPALGEASAAAETPSALPHEAARVRVFHALAEVLTNLAREKPILLIVDDIHWADDLTIGALDYLQRTRMLAGAPILILGILRSEHSSPHLDELAAAEGVSQLSLPRLGDDALRGIIEDMLDWPDAHPGLVALIVRNALGNPFFVAEYLYSAVDRGVLCRHADGTWTLEPTRDELSTGTLGIPVSMRALAEQRLSNLSPDLLALVHAAAILGRQVDVELLRLGAGYDDDELFALISELSGRGIIDRQGGSGLRFTHHIVREVAYQGVPARRRLDLHRGFARALEGRGDHSHSVLKELAHHWERALERDRARECYLRAARAASSSYAIREADSLYQRYFALDHGDSAELWQVRNEWAENILGRRASMQELRDVHTANLALAQRLADPRLESLSRRGLGSVLGQLGRLAEGRAMVAEALRMQEGFGDREQCARSRHKLAMLEALSGNLAESRRLNLAALDEYRSLGDRAGEAWSLNSLAVDEEEAQNFPAALELFAAAAAIWEELGDEWKTWFVRSNLASAHHTLGHVEIAREQYTAALDYYERIGDRIERPINMVYAARLDRQTGADIAGAIAAVDQAETMLREVSIYLDLAVCLCERGHLALARGHSADELLREARAVLQRFGIDTDTPGEQGTALRRLDHAQRAFAAGKPLFRGEDLAVMADGIKRWLVDMGHLPA